MTTNYEVARCDNDTAGDWVGGFWEEVEVDNANTTITFQDGKKLPYESIKSKFIRKVPTKWRFEKLVAERVWPERINGSAAMRGP